MYSEENIQKIIYAINSSVIDRKLSSDDIERICRKTDLNKNDIIRSLSSLVLELYIPFYLDDKELAREIDDKELAREIDEILAEIDEKLAEIDKIDEKLAEIDEMHEMHEIDDSKPLHDEDTEQFESYVDKMAREVANEPEVKEDYKTIICDIHSKLNKDEKMEWFKYLHDIGWNRENMQYMFNISKTTYYRWLSQLGSPL